MTEISQEAAKQLAQERWNRGTKGPSFPWSDLPVNRQKTLREEASESLRECLPAIQAQVREEVEMVELDKHADLTEQFALCAGCLLLRASDAQAQVLAGVKERLLDGLAKLDNEINEYDGLPVGAVEEMIEKTLATLNPNEGEGQ